MNDCDEYVMNDGEDRLKDNEETS